MKWSKGLIWALRSVSSRRSAHSQAASPTRAYDVVIVGAGHNGLVSAAYMAKCGMSVCVLERRHVVGGAAVTEEIVPGFKFSRASYLLSLLRPIVIDQLELKKHGLRYHIKNPTSFTPVRGTNKSLLLGSDQEANQRSIAQFSERDAAAFPKYEHWLTHLSTAVDKLLDLEPPQLEYGNRSLSAKLSQARHAARVLQALSPLGIRGFTDLLDLMASPADKILKKWFESEPLLATLATDGVIGSMSGPKTPGTGYVLLHHVMGELDKQPGAWAFAIGGMGAVSEAMAKAARSYGADIFTSCPVKTILMEGNRAKGVVLSNGTEVVAKKCVFSNATPKVTFLDLMPKGVLSEDFIKAVEAIDYTSPVTKINVAVNQLPNFSCLPNTADSKPMPHHQTTVHLNSESSDDVQTAYVDAEQGVWSRRPLVEMTIPTSVDETMAPRGGHVVHMFTQYTPYHLKNGREWDESTKKEYADLVFDTVEAYCPGFRSSIVGYEALPPPELERVFGLTGGNIFHGTMSLDQLYHARPVLGFGSYRTPVDGFYLCGSGAHPGGGVMGAPGRLAALAAMKDFKVDTKGLQKFDGKV